MKNMLVVTSGIVAMILSTATSPVRVRPAGPVCRSRQPRIFSCTRPGPGYAEFFGR